MELLLIALLLVSNLFLIGRFLKKSDNKPPASEPSPPVAAPEEGKVAAVPAKPDDEDSLISKSIVDLSRIQSLIESKVKARVANMVDEMVERAVFEMTKPEEVGLPPEEPGQQKPAIPSIPKEELDKTFTHKTVSESMGESPETQEPQEGGHDFDALESAVRVAKDEPHTPEEAAAAKETLTQIQGTQIADHIALDPKVRTRMLSIIYGDPDEPITEDTISKKKVVYSGTIDTFDVDKINLNILT